MIGFLKIAPFRITSLESFLMLIETEVFSRMMPDKICNGCKMSTERTTVMIYAISGTEKRTLFVIGKLYV